MRNKEFSTRDIDRLIQNKKIIAQKVNNGGGFIRWYEISNTRCYGLYPERDERETVSLIKKLKQENRIKIYESNFDFITDYFIESVEVDGQDLAIFIIEFISSSNSNNEISQDILMGLISRNKSVSSIIHQILDDLDDMDFQYWFVMKSHLQCMTAGIGY